MSTVGIKGLTSMMDMLLPSTDAYHNWVKGKSLTVYRSEVVAVAARAW